MPYLHCPECRLTTYSAAAHSTRDTCPRCEASLEGAPRSLFAFGVGEGSNRSSRAKYAAGLIQNALVEGTGVFRHRRVEAQGAAFGRRPAAGRGKTGSPPRASAKRASLSIEVSSG